MRLSEVDALLDPTPLGIETGYERGDDGILHVAVRTDLHRCRGDMFEWWFRWRCDTQKYIWWHPVDHVSSEWAEAVEGSHVGSIHLAEERMTGFPAAQLSIQFRDPAEFFDRDGYERSQTMGNISAAVCARVGLGWEPERTDRGEVLGSRLIHIGRDTEWGCVLRSHFFLGQDLVSLGMSAQEVTAIFSDEFGRAVLMHSYNEFTFLSRFLPSLYIGEHRDIVPVALPW